MLYFFLLFFLACALPDACVFLAVRVWSSDGRENDSIVRGGCCVCHFGIRERVGDLHWWLRQKRINRRRKREMIDVILDFAFINYFARIALCFLTTN